MFKKMTVYEIRIFLIVEMILTILIVGFLSVFFETDFAMFIIFKIIPVWGVIFALYIAFQLKCPKCGASLIRTPWGLATPFFPEKCYRCKHDISLYR